MKRWLHALPLLSIGALCTVASEVEMVCLSLPLMSDIPDVKLESER